MMAGYKTERVPIEVLDTIKYIKGVGIDNEKRKSSIKSLTERMSEERTSQLIYVNQIKLRSCSVLKD